MSSFRAIALFCSDVREEVGGSMTIVGVMPDSLYVPSVPKRIGRLTLYTRLMVNPKPNLTTSIALSLRLPDGQEEQLQEFLSEHIKKSQEDARKRKFPFAGITSTLTFGDFMVPMYGRLEVIMSQDGDRELVGALTFTDKESSTSFETLETEGELRVKVPETSAHRSSEKRRPS